jgi:uracil-DNA glycosylase family 4
MFTGDSSGRWLMRALYRADFASQPTSERRDDGLILRNAYITAAVRCAPPDNRPTRRELATCSGYLREELTLLRRVRVVVALGQIAFAAFLRLAQESGAALPRPRPKFFHGAAYRLGTSPVPLVIVASYHPSRQNTQTGRLTEGMLDRIFQLARHHLEPDRSRV